MLSFLFSNVYTYGMTVCLWSTSPVPRQTLQGVMAKEGGMAPAVASAETGSGNAVGPKTVSRSFKMFLLAILCLQNAAYTMLRRWR